MLETGKIRSNYYESETVQLKPKLALLIVVKWFDGFLTGWILGLFGRRRLAGSNRLNHLGHLTIFLTVS